ncbi:hypothetical protein LAWI1_G007390 [Lachnellula willkommii]|uniref:Uncharacterized protein n=1 Tax=Lachnellula willkommii TaxID=215461 RepID=A0A559M3X6_9HELO|nr:hypothetical protein LAWI1_G007390 [Lachnellula willkommii]
MAYYNLGGRQPYTVGQASVTHFFDGLDKEVLENYETVILIARGIGIAGLLLYARHMTYQRVSKDKNHEAYRRGLITRKIDIFWIMDDNS